MVFKLFAILQKYDFSSKSQLRTSQIQVHHVVCDTAKVRFFKQITTHVFFLFHLYLLFAILQKYDFSSKSQPASAYSAPMTSCLRYCKSTIFQANHNSCTILINCAMVVCDTAKVRFFKQITTEIENEVYEFLLFAILQKYDFSSKSQLLEQNILSGNSCLRYCKSTIFQANHNIVYHSLNAR